MGPSIQIRLNEDTGPYLGPIGKSLIMGEECRAGLPLGPLTCGVARTTMMVHLHVLTLRLQSGFYIRKRNYGLW